MKKKIALVTGASGSIGAACARELAKKGYTVLAHANSNLAAAEALALELRAAGMDAHALQCDLSDSAAVSVTGNTSTFFLMAHPPTAWPDWAHPPR